MNTKPVSTTTFKGYDARVLKGFFMNTNCCNIAKEMQAIGQKEGFKIFSIHPKQGDVLCSEGLPKYRKDTANVWAQDSWTFLKNKLLAYEFSSHSNAVKNFFKLKYDDLQKNKRNTPFIQGISANLSALHKQIRRDNFDENYDRTERIPLIREYNNTKETYKTLMDSTHISGGNIFITQDQLLLGENELKKYTIDELKSMFNTDKITILPQMDFHLDLFIRPLDKKRILLTDDNLSLQTIREGHRKLCGYLLSQPEEVRLKYIEPVCKMASILDNYIKVVENNPFAKTEEVEEILKNNGFEVIKVPGRLYSICTNTLGKNRLKHYCNYMNANTLINKDGDLVYITNKSDIDNMVGLTPELSEKIGFSFENAFVESISPYIKKDKVYFIKGDNNFVASKMLSEYQGGIHCTCAEIPEEL